MLTVALVVSILCACSGSVDADNPEFFTLDIGQTFTSTFGGRTSRCVELIDVAENYEMGYWQGGLRKIY